MTPFSAAQIRGTWATLLLPINSDESIDWGRLAEEIEAIVASGAAGVYSNGTAGEFYAQSEAEFDRIQDMLATRCERAGMPFQVGASHMSAQVSLERIRRARQWRPCAIQVILPDWFPLTLEEARAFLDKASEAAEPVGLVLYNPPHAKRLLGPADFGALARAAPALAGVKVARSGADWCADFLREAPGLSLFVPGHELATGAANGAHGSYSNVACIHPAGAARWNRQMATDPAGALDLERRIQAFLRGHVLPFRTEQGISNQGLDKLLAAIGGWTNVGTRLRWPYRWVPGEEAARLRPVARRTLPELFEC